MFATRAKNKYLRSSLRYVGLPPRTHKWPRKTQAIQAFYGASPRLLLWPESGGPRAGHGRETPEPAQKGLRSKLKTDSSRPEMTRNESPACQRSRAGGPVCCNTPSHVTSQTKSCDHSDSPQKKSRQLLRGVRAASNRETVCKRSIRPTSFVPLTHPPLGLRRGARHPPGGGRAGAWVAPRGMLRFLRVPLRVAAAPRRHRAPRLAAMGPTSVRRDQP